MSCDIFIENLRIKTVASFIIRCEMIPKSDRNFVDFFIFKCF